MFFLQIKEREGMRKKKEKGLKLFLGKKQRGGTLEISGKEQDLGVLAWVSGN